MNKTGGSSYCLGIAACGFLPAAVSGGKYSEDALGKLKHKHNAHDNGNSDLQGCKTCLQCQIQPVHHDIIGGPVKTGPRYQGKDAGYEEDCHRTLLSHCKGTGQEDHNDRCKERGYGSRAALKGQQGIDKPTYARGMMEPMIIKFRCAPAPVRYITEHRHVTRAPPQILPTILER